MKITGVIHVGAHYGEEDQDYLRHGIQTRHYFEPMPESFAILTQRVGGANTYNCALGSKEGLATMYVESHNKGQSNSLLEPGTHLKHYPLIKFDNQIQVIVALLDSLEISNCNLLNMDVQGFELEVLKGATETLQHVEYIYTEVNTDEVYKGCGKLDEMDAYLSDFTRVELAMTGQGWGDALYIRKRAQMIAVPEDYRPHHPLQYPPDNDLIFEEWYAQQPHPPCERVYLPIFWTSYYCKWNYGKNQGAINRLQNYLNNLDRSKKYYTIVQYDDGILNNLSHLDIKVFASAGNRIDYPLPLICKPHRFTPAPVKDIFCSYIGGNNHPIRKNLMQYQNKTHWYISDRVHSLQHYCDIMSRSKYVLCPRGYGKTSFRIMEALQYGAIPVYISDEFIEPHYDFSYGIKVTNPGPELDEMLHMSEELVAMKPQEAFEKYFTYEANLKIIHENI